MATAALACPFCKKWVRVAVQASRVTRASDGQLRVEFDVQMVAHICDEE